MRVQIRGKAFELDLFDPESCLFDSFIFTMIVVFVSERRVVAHGAGQRDGRSVGHAHALPGLASRQALQDHDAGLRGCEYAIRLISQ